MLFVGALVGFDDALHKGVAHDVFFAELDAADAFDVAQHAQGLY